MVSSSVFVKGRSRSGRRNLRAGTAALALALAGCTTSSPAPPPVGSPGELLSSDTDLVVSLFRSAASTPLSAHPLCAELTGEGGSRTIARYIAAILAEHGPDTANWLALDISRRGRSDGWDVSFLPLGGTEQDPQLWGLEFQIRQSDRQILPDSLRCYVAWEGWW
jgi:hypothetical protein